MVVTSTGRPAILGLIVASLCAPLHARMRGAGITSEQMLRRSLAALQSPDLDTPAVITKRQALSDLTELHDPPANAEALAVDALRGPVGNSLAPAAGKLLLRLGVEKRHTIEKLVAAGEIPDFRGEVALKPFEEADEARVDWETGTGLTRSRGLMTLLQLSALTHDDFAKAIVDKDANVRWAAALAANFLDLSDDEWKRILDLLHDRDVQVRQGAMRALMEDSLPNPSRFDEAIFVVRYDPACRSAMVTWFEQAAFSRDQIDQLKRDLQTRQPVDRSLAMELLTRSTTTRPEDLLEMLVAAGKWQSPGPARQVDPSLGKVLDRLYKDCLGKPELEQQILAKAAPLLRDRSTTASSRELLLVLTTRLNVDTSDLADLFVKELVAAEGRHQSLPDMCLMHAWRMNQAKVDQVLWQALHDPDPRHVRVVRAYIADNHLDEMWLVALKNGNTAERSETLEGLAAKPYTVDPEGWSALAACMQDPDPALRQKALRALLHVTPSTAVAQARDLQPLSDILLAALNDSDVGVRQCAMASLPREVIHHRPEFLGAIITGLNDRNEGLQATAWQALAVGVENGDFKDLRQSYPKIGDTLKSAIWYGKPSIRDSASKAWRGLYPGASLPRSPEEIGLLAVLGFVCSVPFGLLCWGSWRGRGEFVQADRPISSLDKGAHGVRAVGYWMTICAIAIELLTLLAAGSQAVATVPGQATGLALLASALMGLAIIKWGGLVRTGRMLDRIVALILVSLASVPCLPVCLVYLGAAFTSRGILAILTALSQFVTTAALFGIGVYAIWHICRTFRASSPPPVPVGLDESGSRQMDP